MISCLFVVYCVCVVICFCGWVVGYLSVLVLIGGCIRLCVCTGCLLWLLILGCG